MYAGPALTYFEVVEAGKPGAPPPRLTDQEWRARLAGADRAAPPAWTAGFRPPSPTAPALRRVPTPPSEALPFAGLSGRSRDA
jgi:hypothetical protein